MSLDDSREFAAKLDLADPPRAYRDRFRLPIAKHGQLTVYLCRNPDDDVVERPS